MIRGTLRAWMDHDPEPQGGKLKPSELFVPGLLVGVLFLFAACGGGQEAPSPAETAPAAPTGGSGAGTVSGTGDSAGGATGGGTDDLVARGQEIFTRFICATCHIVEGVSTGRIGPDLTHIGTDGASRKPGLSAEEYIFESIRDPEAFVADGVERAFAGTMTKDITDDFSDEEVSALVAFLLAQK